MPIRVTLRVKRGSSLPVNERAKKQRMTDLPPIRVNSEIVTIVEEVTVKTEEIDDGSTESCDHSASESALCQPSADPHLSHSASTSSTTSKQFTSQVGTSDNAEMYAFEGSLKGNLIDSILNHDNKSPPINNGFSELQREEKLEYEEVAQNSTAHKQAAIPFLLNNTKKIKHTSWDERFKELVDFKAINGHTNARQGSGGPLGAWVHAQRSQYCLLKKGTHSTLTNDKCEQLKNIGFEFKRRPSRTRTPWYQRFEELVDFKKIHGHANVPTKSGPLGTWVDTQRQAFRQLKEGKHSTLTNDKREKLESIGFIFICRPSRTLTPWDQRYQELVDFKKNHEHTNAPQGSGPLGTWVDT